MSFTSIRSLENFPHLIDGESLHHRGSNDPVFESWFPKPFILRLGPQGFAISLQLLGVSKVSDLRRSPGRRKTTGTARGREKRETRRATWKYTALERRGRVEGGVERRGNKEERSYGSAWGSSVPRIVDPGYRVGCRGARGCIVGVHKDIPRPGIVVADAKESSARCTVSNEVLGPISGPRATLKPVESSRYR